MPAPAVAMTPAVHRGNVPVDRAVPAVVSTAQDLFPELPMATARLAAPFAPASEASLLQLELLSRHPTRDRIAAETAMKTIETKPGPARRSPCRCKAMMSGNKSDR